MSQTEPLITPIAPHELAAFEDTFASALLGLLGVADRRMVSRFTVKSAAPNVLELLVERIVGRPDALGCVVQLQTERFLITAAAGEPPLAGRVLRSLGVTSLDAVIAFELRVVGPETAYLTVQHVLSRSAPQQALLEQMRGERLTVIPQAVELDANR